MTTTLEPADRLIDPEPVVYYHVRFYGPGKAIEAIIVTSSLVNVGFVVWCLSNWTVLARLAERL